MDISRELFPYQTIGKSWLAGRRNALLADEMGLGKTSQAIRAADEIGAKNILVVCPGIARANWEREFQSWQQVPRSICPVYATDQDVMSHDVIICSFGGIIRERLLDPLLRRSWDRIIVDEAHYAKEPESYRTRCLYGWRCDGKHGLVSRADGTWLLTGTPTPNGPHEIWPHMRALFQEGVVGLESYGKWMERFCITCQGDYGNFVVAGQNLNEWAQRVKPFALRRHVKDVLPDLPPLRFGHVVVHPETVPPIPPELLEAQYVLRAALEADEEAMNWAGSAHLASLRKWTGVAKAKAVADSICEDLHNGLDKLIVFAVHREVIAILNNTIPDSVAIHGDTPQKLRQNYLDSFEGKLPGRSPKVIILNMQIASTNLTLTSAHNVAFAETSWVPAEIIQAVKRAHRIGQNMPVLARIFSLAGSVDEALNNTLLRKLPLVTQMESSLAYDN